MRLVIKLSAGLCFLVFHLGGEEYRDLSQYVPGEVLVKFKDNAEIRPAKGHKVIETGIRSIDQLNQQFQVMDMEPVFKTVKKHTRPRYIKTYTGEILEVPQLFNIYKLKVPDEADLLKVIEAYQNDPNVVYAEPNYIAHIVIIPNDTDFFLQWGLHNTGQYKMEAADIDAPEAWDIETGDATLIIGIIDTGVEWDHPDLAANILNHGYDFVNDDNDAMDDNGHGTHVAGIAAAVTNNSLGIAGVAWNSKILPVKVMQSNGQGSYSDIAEGVVYAADNGAKVINLSLGGYAESGVLLDALENAYTNAVIVAAAGNDDTDEPFYPAAWEFVIGVGASDVLYNYQTGQWYEGKADFSNFGINSDLFAPGVDIYSTFPQFHPRGFTYTYLNGTSMAAPFVTGAVALLRSYSPTWSNELIHGQLINTADQIEGGVRLNAYQALIEVAIPQLAFYLATVVDTLAGDDEDGIADAGETVELILDLHNTWGDAYNVQATLKPRSHEDTSFITINDSTATFGGISAYAHATNADPYVIQIKSNTPNNTNIYFDCEITCDNGDTVVNTFYLTAQRGTEIGGKISANATWTPDYLYIITSNVKVEAGVTLTIEPGTHIQFDADKYLQIDGTLMARGTSDSIIVFTSNAQTPQAGDWKYIKFASSSTDASFDADGNYVSGSIIQYAEVRYGQGIWADTASPYLANNLLSDNSSVDVESYYECVAPVYLVNSTSRVEHNTFRNNTGKEAGGVFVLSCSHAKIADNLIEDNSGEAGGIRVSSSDSTVLITENVIRWNNPVRGGGGISVYSSNSSIIYNVIDGNKSEENKGGIVFYGGGSARCENNTIMNNAGGIVIWKATPRINNNNLLNNHTGNDQYEIRQWKEVTIVSSDSINARNNHWGTADVDLVEAWIWDETDDFDLGKVNYEPMETTPVITAPGMLYQVEFNPPPPIGVEVDTITLSFSKPMDISIEPAVSFGVTDPYTQHAVEGTWLDSTHWQGSSTFNIMTGDGINYLRVFDDKDYTGMELPKDTRFTFVVNAAGASSEGFAAQITGEGVVLNWPKPEMVDLMGYNMYRYQIVAYADTDTTYSDTTLINTNLILDTSYVDREVQNNITYFYMYAAFSTDFQESDYSKVISITPTGIVGIGEKTESVPIKFMLSANYPNPCRSKTEIRYALPQEVKVTLKLYNTLGQEVCTLVDKLEKPGYYTVRWEGHDHNRNPVASGIYFYTIKAGEFQATKKLILLK